MVCPRLDSPISVAFIHQLIRSFSVLGLVPGVLVTIGVAATVQYTSLILWRFCMKHPEVRDVCDLGRILFGGSQWGYNFTAIMFILNNTFIQGSDFTAAPNFHLISHRQRFIVSSEPSTSIQSRTPRSVRPDSVLSPLPYAFSARSHVR